MAPSYLNARVDRLSVSLADGQGRAGPDRCDARLREWGQLTGGPAVAPPSGA